MSTPAGEVPMVKPGLYRGLPYDEYARWDAVRHTVLRHFNRTPAHARQAMTAPADQTPEQTIGHAAHVAILEPERFEIAFAVQPYMGDRRSSKVRAEEDAYRAAHPDVSFLPKAEHDLCLALRAAVWAHPTASELLRGKGVNEVSALWIDPDTGVRVKARIDRLTQLGEWSGIVCDLKTTRDASPRSFSRDIYTLHYAQQAALYLDGLNALAPRPRKFMFIAVEKDPPYAVAVYELDQDAIDLAGDQYRKHLAAYARCVETGVWPGWGDGVGYISIPSWAFKFHGEEA